MQTDSLGAGEREKKVWAHSQAPRAKMATVMDREMYVCPPSAPVRSVHDCAYHSQGRSPSQSLSVISLTSAYTLEGHAAMTSLEHLMGTSTGVERSHL